MCGPGRSIELRRVRIQWTKLMVHLMEETKSTEEELVSIRPSHLATVLKGKRFGLLHAALESCGYPDSQVALEASVGFPLVGWMRCAGVFAAHVRPPELHVSAFEDYGGFLTQLELWPVSRPQAVLTLTSRFGKLR